MFTTLSYRRVEMIEVYKIVNKIYDENVTKRLVSLRGDKNVNLRGHRYTLEQKRIYKSAAKNFFSNKVVQLWKT